MYSQKPLKSRVPFEQSDIRRKEMDEFITNARAKSSSGNDGFSYSIYKYFPTLCLYLFALIIEMWKKNDPAERWCIAEGIYLDSKCKSKH